MKKTVRERSMERSRLGAVVQGHALAQPVCDGALAGGSGLGEGSAATEGAGSSTVADADNADVLDAGDSSLASCTGGHLDLKRELGSGGKAQTLDTKAWNVLDDLGFLESIGLGATRGAINIGGHGAGAILVNLAECHLDDAVGADCRQTGAGTLAHAGLYAGLRASQDLGATAACETTTTEALEEVANLADDKVARHGRNIFGLLILDGDKFATAGGRKPGSALGSSTLPRSDVGRDVVLLTDTGGVAGRCCTHAHEVLDHNRGVDGTTTLGAAER